MKWLLPTSVAALLLALPGEGRACGLCIESGLLHTIPTYHWLLLALLLWGITHTVWGERWQEVPDENTRVIVKKFAKFVVLAIVLVLITGGSTALITLVLAGMFLGTSYRVLFRGAAPKGRKFLLTAAVLLAGLIAFGVAQRIIRDPLDHARATIAAGTKPFRGISVRIASDPNFDLDRLRPMIVEEKGTDREWAFHILGARKDPEDVERFSAELATLPDEYFGSYPWRQPGGGYMRSWLNSVDVEVEELAAQLGKQPDSP